MDVLLASGSANDEVRFGPFFLNISTRKLRHNGTTVPLKPKEAELLVLLASRREKPISRDEIMESLWGLHKATDYALSQTVYRLRRALAAFDSTCEYVRTVPGVGYHLVAATLFEERDVTFAFSDPAFRYYQRAMFKLKQRTQAHVLESIASFEAALAVNPSFVPALNGIAKVYTNAGIRTFMDPVEAYYRAKAALVRAISLEPGNADAFTTLSLLVLFFDADPAGARDAAEQALLLAPQSQHSRNAMVWQLLARRDHTAALAEADRALCASPSDAHFTALMGIALYLLQRYDEARERFAESLEFSPSYTPGLFYYACSHYMTGRYDEALALLNAMPETEMSSRVLALRGCIAIRQGRESARRHIAAQLEALPFRADVSIAAMHVASDRLDAAAASLAAALDTREPGLFLTTIDPMYEPLEYLYPALVAEIRKGRPPCCDRCAKALPLATTPIHALRLCDACKTLA